MNVFFGIIIAILIFSFVVLIHELGHFLSARFFGVKVEEFGLGIPPRAKKIFTDKKGTLFSLNWLPLGGFVRLKGENKINFLIFDENKNILKEAEILKYLEEGKEIFAKNGKKLTKEEKNQILKILQESDKNDNLYKKSTFAQSVILLAGVFNNFLLAFFIFFILFLVGIKPLGINNQIETNLDLKLIPTLEQAFEIGLLQKNPGIIVSPVDGSLAKTSGLNENDIILEINGEEINDLEKFSEILGKNKNSTIEIKRNCLETCEENISLSLDETGKIGAFVGENISVNQNFKYKFGIIDSAKFALLEVKNQSLLTLKGIGIIFKKVFFPEKIEDRQEALDNVAGPIGIVNFISSTFSAGIVFLLTITAIISISLGVFNLLPIPALDGGRFFIVIINAFFRKIFGKNIIGENSEAIIHFVFFMILIILSILIGYNDIQKII